MNSCDVCLSEGEGFSSPFSVSSEWTAVLIKGGAEEFKGDAIEEFLLVVADDSKDAAHRLIDILQSKNMGEGKVIK